ncbi:MAG: FHA domain-containing protein [Polyangiaceae bacterium]|nr:FHA domain-containing protein [Polyangiaceae bacterium]
MRVLKFQIRNPTGQIDQLSIEAERVLIGSGGHCEIRLPVDQARVEHVRIDVGPNGVLASALTFQPPPTINNVPFQQAPLAAGAVLGVGSCQILVELAKEGAVADTKKKKGSSPVSLIALVLILGAGGYMFLADDGNQGQAEAPPEEIPELWSAPTTNCPSAQQQIAVASQQMESADAKRARAPFYVQDGVQAVPLYESAEACFRAGGDKESAALAHQSAERLRRDIINDFRTRRVRLAHSLAIEDYNNAQKEVWVLLQLTEGKTGKYVTWLQNQNRELKLKVGTTKS